MTSNVALRQGHLAKPIRMRSLKAAIKEWLPRHLFHGAASRSEQKAPHNPEQALLKSYAERRETTFEALDQLDANNPLDRGEVEAVAQMLHKLAGTAGMFGEAELGEEARIQEQALLDAEEEDVNAAVRTAQQAFAKWKSSEPPTRLFSDAGVVSPRSDEMPD